jgi:hypothetical protein
MLSVTVDNMFNDMEAGPELKSKEREGADFDYE